MVSASTLDHANEAVKLNDPNHDNADARDPSYILGNERTFTCFSKLPFELRMIVWKFACYHERNLFIWLAQPFSRKILDYPDEDPFKYVTTTPPPAVLQACQDSRGAGLEHYHPVFSSKFEIGYTEILTPAHIYANFETDRIFLLGRWFPQDLHKVFFWVLNKIAFSTALIKYGTLPSDFDDRVFEDILLFNGCHDISNTHGTCVRNSGLIDLDMRVQGEREQWLLDYKEAAKEPFSPEAWAELLKVGTVVKAISITSD